MEKLNLIVHHRNSKGKITRKTPYRLVVQNGLSIYEMPAGSGEFFLSDGSAYDGVSPINNKPSKDAQKAQELAKRNAELEAKLALIEAKQQAAQMVKQEEAKPAAPVTPEKEVEAKPESKK